MREMPTESAVALNLANSRRVIANWPSISLRFGARATKIVYIVLISHAVLLVFS